MNRDYGKGGAAHQRAKSSYGGSHPKLKACYADGGKVGRYDDGGEVGNKNPYQGDDVDPFSAVRNSDGGTESRSIPDAAPRESVGKMDGLEKKSESAPAQPMKFGAAFAAARKAGQSTFMWQGKKYTTDLASSKPATEKAPEPAPARQSLAQSKGKEFAELEKVARDAEANPEYSRAAKAAARANADRARKTYEDAAAAEREGTSVVRKR